MRSALHLILILFAFVSCTNSNKQATTKNSNDFELLEKEQIGSHGFESYMISVYTQNKVGVNEATQICNQFAKEKLPFTIFFYDTKEITDENYYAYTDGKFLNYKDGSARIQMK